MSLIPCLKKTFISGLKVLLIGKCYVLPGQSTMSHNSVPIFVVKHISHVSSRALKHNVAHIEKANVEKSFELRSHERLTSIDEVHSRAKK